MKLPPSKTRAAIYARTATTPAAVAIDDQITSCRKFIQRHDWVEAGVYADAARSGSTFAGRHGYFSMMAGAERGEFSVVLVEDLDRLSRGPIAVHRVVRNLDDLGVAVCTVRWGLIDDLALAYKAACDSSYAKSLGRPGRRKHVETVHREIVRPEAAVVRRIYDLFTAGLGVDEVCRRLNKEGVPGFPAKPAGDGG